MVINSQGVKLACQVRLNQRESRDIAPKKGTVIIDKAGEWRHSLKTVMSMTTCH